MYKDKLFALQLLMKRQCFHVRISTLLICTSVLCVVLWNAYYFSSEVPILHRLGRLQPTDKNEFFHADFWLLQSDNDLSGSSRLFCFAPPESCDCLAEMNI